MLLRAGVLSLALLVASRLLGLLRESAQAAAFGATGLADVAVLMLSLPDWLAGVLASGALAYVMLPAWSAGPPAAVQATQRRLARWMLAGGFVLGLLLLVGQAPVLRLLVPGLAPGLQGPATQAMAWAGAALPLALLAALWATRLQHERAFGAMYAASLVVNVTLVVLLLVLAGRRSLEPSAALALLGAGLVVAMALRLAWQQWRLPPPAAAGGIADASLPGASAWIWAALAAGLPLALPFAARSVASGAGEGALAAFHYAWKLIELPLGLGIQLVATLAFPSIARAFALPPGPATDPGPLLRSAFGLAWALACAAAAALLLAAPALAQVLFGWGRMQAAALADVAAWARIGAWGLLPQALIAVALTVLAARRRLRAGALAYAAALALLLAAAAGGLADGAQVMRWLNGLFTAVALVLLGALRPGIAGWLPWKGMAMPMLLLGGCAVAASWTPLQGTSVAVQLAAGAAAALVILATALLASSDLRTSLRR